MIVTTTRDRRIIETARGRKRRRGAVAVELALSVAFLVVPLLVGIWEIGCLLDAQQTLLEATDQGKRQAINGSLTNAQVQQVVLQYLSNAGVSTTGVTVTVVNTTSGLDASQAATNDQLVITATLPFRNVDWSMTQKYVSDSSTLSATAVGTSGVDSPPLTGPSGPSGWL